MKIDPRNPPKDALIRANNSTHPAHQNFFRNLVLLSLETKDGTIYFVVENAGIWPLSQESEKFFYEEHQCPTNFIRVARIFYEGDGDVHGLFTFVESVWMTTEYQSLDKEYYDEYLQEVFPQLRKTNED